MTRNRNALPQPNGPLYLVYTGMETDLLFNQGVDLPGFASYPLLESEQGRRRLRGYFTDLIHLGRQTGTGVILESPTWVANRDRAAELGYGPQQLATLNRQALALMAAVRDQVHETSAPQKPDRPTLLSANIGPRQDAYAPEAQMTIAEAQDYHREQITALADSAVDLISGYTLAYPNEAAGMMLACREFGLPGIIAFTVETDGRLPTGASLPDAIKQVDDATEGYAAYYMINCAHPDHFASVLDGAPWMDRLRGLVANASRCSHAELDEATSLDDGDPQELGQQLAALRQRFPQLAVLGGCCGTDMRHLRHIAAAALD